MRARPKIYRPWWVLLLAVPGAVVLIADGLAVVVVVMIGAVILYLGLLWLLAPYSKRAWLLLRPDAQTFDRRSARVKVFADSLGRVPLFGIAWRWAQRVSAPTVERMQADYRASLDDESRDA